MSKLDKSKRSTRTSVSSNYGKGQQFQIEIPKGPHTTGVDQDLVDKDLFWHEDGIIFTDVLIDQWIKQCTPSAELGNLSDHRLIVALKHIRKLHEEIVDFRELEWMLESLDPEVLLVLGRTIKRFKDNHPVGVSQFIKKE